MDSRKRKILVSSVLGVSFLMVSALFLHQRFQSQDREDYPKTVEENVSYNGTLERARAGNLGFTVINTSEKQVRIYSGAPQDIVNSNTMVSLRGDIVEYKVTEPVGSEFRQTVKRGLNVTGYEVIEEDFGVELMSNGELSERNLKFNSSWVKVETGWNCQNSSNPGSNLSRCTAQGSIINGSCQERAKTNVTVESGAQRIGILSCG